MNTRRKLNRRTMPLSVAALLAAIGTLVSVYAFAWAIRTVLNVG